MEEGYEIHGVFLDILKAFELKQNGINSNLLNILEDFLRNRK